MIHYEMSDSPFFVQHEKFCKALEIQFNSHNYSYNGYCNSFGYEVKAELQNSNPGITIIQSKHQTTRNGVIVPMDASEQITVEVKMIGLNNGCEIVLGKNKLRRLFCSRKIKDQLPSPYFLHTSNTEDMEAMAQIASLIKKEVTFLSLNAGNLIVRFNRPENDIIYLISELKKSFNRS